MTRAPVIPVRSFAETIRQQLDDIWQREPAAQVTDSFDGLRVIYWARSADELRRSEGYVECFLAGLGQKTQVETTVASELAIISNVDLIVAVGDEPPLDYLFRSAASLLIIRQPDALPRAVLHVLRGHIPDYRALDWLTPLASHMSAEVTLLMGVDGHSKKPPVSDLSSILLAQDRRNTHIAECRRRLRDAGLTGRLKLRQGELLAVIAEELAAHPYDLVAIAAEAYGDFAQQVSELTRSAAPAFLVIKP